MSYSRERGNGMFVNYNKLTTWTPENVLELLESSDLFIERCILLLHERQTEIEKLARVTIQDNEKGLQQADALCFSLLAEKLSHGEHLNEVDLAETKVLWHRGRVPVIRIGKYRKQIVRIFEVQAKLAMENPR